MPVKNSRQNHDSYWYESLKRSEDPEFRRRLSEDKMSYNRAPIVLTDKINFPNLRLIVSVNIKVSVFTDLHFEYDKI